MNALIQVARDASPYLAVELLLPGGSVIALLLWLFRHRSKKGAGAMGMEIMRTLGRPAQRGENGNANPRRLQGTRTKSIITTHCRPTHRITWCFGERPASR